MRTVKHLFARLVDPAHLERAMRRTTHGKRRRPDVAWYLLHAEAELDRLRERLVRGTWQPAPFDTLRLRDPKPRIIARTLIEDRVAHAALAGLLEEAWAPRLLPCDMACRRGHGAHRARLALQRGLRTHRFVVHLDIRAYFPSIELDSLRRVLRRRIRDDRFLGVLDQVIEGGAGLIDAPGRRAFLGVPEDWPPRGRGLPVGAYTSQVLATHVVLDELDHHVKRALKVPFYVRYVDDLFLFGERRADLRRWRADVGRWLREERDLRLKYPQARVLAGAGTLYGLGARITRHEIGPTRRALTRFEKRVRAQLPRTSARSRRRFERSVASSVGLLG